MKKIFICFALVSALLAGQSGYAACSYPNYSGSYGRYLTSFKITDGAGDQSVSVGQTATTGVSIYFNKTASIVSSSAGAVLSFSDISWSGSWMHGYLYIDYNKDGDFGTLLNSNGTTGGELVSYSYLSGKDSKGNSASEGAGISAGLMPSFTLPADLASGDYTARFKVDWNNSNSCGDSNIGSNAGVIADFTIRIAAPVERTVTVKSADAAKGSVSIDGESGTSVRKAGPVTVIATPDKGFSFVNWTNEKTGASVATTARFIQNGSEDIILVANFTTLTYPVMKRTFTNNKTQENRYIKKVTTTGTNTPTVFSAATQSELPYTAFSAAAGTYVTEGAMLDKTAVPIEIEQGTTSFKMNYFGWEDNIGSATKQIDWTQDAYFIDWNGNGVFTDAGETSAKSSDNQQNTALYDADGYSRTITVPAGQPSGTYRMRVVFFEPSPYTEQWQSTLFTTKSNGVRNGISYEFLIQILDPTDMEVESASVTKSGGRVNPNDKNVILASVNVKTTGSLNALSLTELKVQYTGTTTGDINNLRWVYSTSGSVTENVVASAATAKSDMTFEADKKLTLGNNFFILIADVANAAAIGDKIKVAVNSVKVAGADYDLEVAPGESEYTVSNIVDYTKGNAIWFDTPTSSTNGAEAWKKNDFSGTATNPDEIWERQSFPIGNGSLGGNVLGSINRERVVLNEKTLWKGGPGTGASTYWNMNKTVSASTLSTIRNYLVSSQNSSAHGLVTSNYRGNINYDKTKFGTYTMMGEAYVSTGIDESSVTGYKRIMNIDSSMVIVQFSSKGVDYKRRFFCSYPDSVMVWRFTSEGGTQNLTFSFNCPQIVNSVTKVDGGLLYNCSLDNNGVNWAFRVYARANGGGVVNADASAKTITVSAASDVEFIVTADTDYKMNFNPSTTDNKAFVGVDPIKSVNDIMDAAKEKSYDELYDNHHKDYSKLFGRVDLSINPEQKFENLPTPTRLANYRNGTLDHTLEQIYFQYGRYLLISCSRAGNMPANLQGMWHNNIDGPWRVDYHNNINLQMNYWPATCTNLLECFVPFIDYVKGLVKPGERTANAYYGARGWTAEVSTNIYGFTAPLNDGDMSWNYNPTAGPWLATQIWEYYDYTRDKEWLRNVGYDIIKSSANFVSDLLYKANGTYTSAPSYSPEHGTCDLGATYANAVTREVLIEAIKSAEILGTDAALVTEWKDKLDNMYPYQVGRYGQLQEWYKDIDTYNDDHRHTNHLFGLHPGSTVNPITTPALANACKETLKQRGDAATGWSMGWKLNHWARLQDGDHAYTLFKNLLKNGTANNLWDLHPPFQIDGNFGGTAGVSELFLQSQADTLYILPALPSDWTNGHITGLLARGNFEVSIYYNDNKLDYATVKSNKGEECRVRYKGEKMAFPTVAGGVYKVAYDKGTGKLSYTTITGVEDPVIERSEVKEQVNIFPNPNKGNFTVQVKGEVKGDINIAVYSALGQKVKDITVSKDGEYIEVPFSCDPVSGYYFVNVNGKGISESKKFIVK